MTLLAVTVPSRVGERLASGLAGFELDAWAWLEAAPADSPSLLHSASVGGLSRPTRRLTVGLISLTPFRMPRILQLK